MRSSKLKAVASVLTVVAILAVGWFLVRDTDWWQYLTASAADEASGEPAETQAVSTATVTLANVADVADLDATLRYQDRVEFVHRVDPIITTTVETITTPAPAAAASTDGRRVQTAAAPTVETITTTTEEDGTRAITALPTPGQIVAPGDVLYESDSTPVFAIQGEVAAWRTMKSGAVGEDIAQLHAFLVRDGWADASLEGDAWLAETTTAVQQWQDATEQTITGLVELGDVWFIDGPIRITEVVATEGLIVGDGEPLFTYTSQQRAIEASLDALPDGLLDADDIEARLPDGSTVPVAIASVRGTDSGFDLVFDVDLSASDVPSINGVRVALTWTVSEIVDVLTVPPEALRRTDSGVYVVDVVSGDSFEPTEVQVVGQAGRVVAIEGIIEGVEVRVP